MLRSRKKLVDQRKQLRTHILSLLRRNGRHFRQETPNKTHWTLLHQYWLEKVVTTSSGSFALNLSLLVRQLKAVNSILVEYSQSSETMAKTERYKRSVQALTCCKGIKNLFCPNYDH